MQIKTVCLLIIIIIFSTLSQLYSDSTKTEIDAFNTKLESNSDKSEKNLKTHKKSEAVENNFNSHAVYNAVDNNDDFNIIPIISTLLGSFFAACIAIYTVKATHKKNIELAKKKQEIRYNSLLFSIFSELTANYSELEEIEKQVDIYVRAVDVYDKLTTEDMFNTINVKFIEQCRINMVDNEVFSLKVIDSTSRYIDHANALNNHLKSSRIREVKTFLPPDKSLSEATKLYFTSVNNYIKQFKETSIYVRKVILDDHKKYPHIDIKFGDASLENELNDAHSS